VKLKAFNMGILARSSILLFGLSLLTACSLTTSKKLGLSDGQTESPALAFQSDQEFGSGLSQHERSKLSAAEQKAFEFGKPGTPVTWMGEGKSVSGSIVVSQPFRVGQSSCLRFSHKLKNDKQNEQTSGTACRRDGGPWKLVK